MKNFIKTMLYASIAAIMAFSSSSCQKGNTVVSLDVPEQNSDRAAGADAKGNGEDGYSSGLVCPARIRQWCQNWEDTGLRFFDKNTSVELYNLGHGSGTPIIEAETHTCTPLVKDNLEYRDCYDVYVLDFPNSSGEDFCLDTFSSDGEINDAVIHFYEDGARVDASKNFSYSDFVCADSRYGLGTVVQVRPESKLVIFFRPSVPERYRDESLEFYFDGDGAGSTFVLGEMMFYNPNI